MVRIFIRTCALLLALWPAASACGESPEAAYPSEEALRHYSTGRSLEEAGETGEALREYYRALALDPKAMSVDERVSELSARLGDASRSLEFAERGLTLAPADARLLWLKGAALFHLGRAQEALPALQAAVAADSEEADFSRTLAPV